MNISSGGQQIHTQSQYCGCMWNVGVLEVLVNLGAQNILCQDIHIHSEFQGIIHIALMVLCNCMFCFTCIVTLCIFIIMKHASSFISFQTVSLISLFPTSPPSPQARQIHLPYSYTLIVENYQDVNPISFLSKLSLLI